MFAAETSRSSRSIANCRSLFPDGLFRRVILPNRWAPGPLNVKSMAGLYCSSSSRRRGQGDVALDLQRVLARDAGEDEIVVLLRVEQLRLLSGSARSAFTPARRSCSPRRDAGASPRGAADRRLATRSASGESVGLRGRQNVLPARARRGPIRRLPGSAVQLRRLPSLGPVGPGVSWSFRRQCDGESPMVTSNVPGGPAAAGPRRRRRPVR